MGATATYSLPYPELDEPDDVPTDMRELATAVETAGPLGWWAGGTFTVPGQLAASYFNATYGRVTARAGFVDEVYIGDRYGDATTPSIAFGSARDTWLYRSAAGQLKTDGYLFVGLGEIIRSGDAAQVALGSLNQLVPSGPASAGIAFGSTGDTNLYRAAANQLATDDAFLTRFDYLYPGANMSGVFPTLQASNGQGAAIGWNYSGGEGEVNFWNTYAAHGGNVPSFKFVQMTGAGTTTHCLSINGDGRLTIGQPADTNLYRVGAGYLKTDGSFAVGGSADLGGWLVLDTSGGGFGILVGPTNQLQITRAGATGRMQIHDLGGSPGIAFGNANDTNLYRAAAGILKTDGAFATGGAGAGSPAFYASVVGDSANRLMVDASGAHFWGPGNAAPDTNLYRYTSQQLKTDSSFLVAGNTVVDANATSARLYFGNVGDTVLYRGGAGQLQLDGRLHIGGTGGVPAVLKLGAGYDSTGFGNVGGDRGIFIGNTSNYPVGAAATGGHLFAVNGVLFWRGSSGTTTQIAPA